jgi:hypothetical protein
MPKQRLQHGYTTVLVRMRRHYEQGIPVAASPVVYLRACPQQLLDYRQVGSIQGNFQRGVAMEVSIVDGGAVIKCRAHDDCVVRCYGGEEVGGCVAPVSWRLSGDGCGGRQHQKASDYATPCGASQT